VVLVINVNISLVGLTLLSSIFQTSSTMEWHGLKDEESLLDAKDKGLAQDSRSRLYIFYFSDPRSH
jgi:site-specific DNA-cytosine methylase